MGWGRGGGGGGKGEGGAAAAAERRQAAALSLLARRENKGQEQQQQDNGPSLPRLLTDTAPLPTAGTRGTCLSKSRHDGCSLHVSVLSRFNRRRSAAASL